MYTARTQEEILSELQSWYGGGASLIEGTFAGDVFASNAIEFAKVEVEISEAYKNAFGNTCAVEYLDLRAAEAGITRRPANKAIGKLKVIGSGIVYENSIFSTAAGVRFLSTKTVEVDGEAEIDIIAESAGALGNVEVGAINKIPMNIAGIYSCINDTPTYDGYDEESDEDLRARYLLKVRQPGNSGSPRHYLDWALSVVGVGAARVQRCWQGAGTVKVVVADSNLNACNVELLRRVYEVIEANRPVGAEVTVVSARIIPIHISAKITGTLEFDALREGVTSYFKKITRELIFGYNASFAQQPPLYVPLAQITACLVAAGADNVHNLTINSAAEDFRLADEEIPQLGTLQFE